MKLPAEFNYNSREWDQLKAGLLDDLDNAVGQLCNANCGPTQADQLRGRILLIKDILGGAEAAARERLRQGGNLNGN
jgi:hypothetical protein